MALQRFQKPLLFWTWDCKIVRRCPPNLKSHNPLNIPLFSLCLNAWCICEENSIHTFSIFNLYFSDFLSHFGSLTLHTWTSISIHLRAAICIFMYLFDNSVSRPLDRLIRGPIPLSTSGGGIFKDGQNPYVLVQYIN